MSLAQVVRAEVLPSGGVRYFFKVERRFKGPNVTSFSLAGEASIWDGSTNTFNHHNDEKFDRPNFGRVANDTDCEIYPNFSVGGHYLIFRDLPRTRKSFELIIRTHGTRDVKDKWLQRVESYFAL